MTFIVQRLKYCGSGVFRLQPREVHMIKVTNNNAKAVRRFLRQNKVHFMADLSKSLFVIRQPDGDKLTVRAGEWLLKRSFFG